MDIPIGKSIDEFMAERMQEITPVIDDSAFSDSERQQVTSILLLLHELNSAIGQLSNDVALFDYCQTHPEMMMQWTPIASRDAAMTIRDFLDAITHIQTAVKKCQSLKTVERERALRGAIGAFNAAFQYSKQIRDVAAHPAGQAATPECRINNSIRGTGVIVRNSWSSDGTVTNTRHGRAMTFMISDTSVQTLKGIRNLVFQAFQTCPEPRPVTGRAASNLS